MKKVPKIPMFFWWLTVRRKFKAIQGWTSRVGTGNDSFLIFPP